MGLKTFWVPKRHLNSSSIVPSNVEPSGNAISSEDIVRRIAGRQQIELCIVTNVGGSQIIRNGLQCIIEKKISPQPHT
jgi:hypothetical protein